MSVGSGSSPPVGLFTGVPQGSVLGPLLFLVFINDLSKTSNFLKYVHFDDDTTVYVSGPDLGELVEGLNRELINVDDWLRANKLSLNLAKTTFMLFTHCLVPQSLTVTIRDQHIRRVSVAKFLGVIIDEKLTFGSHISSVCKRIARSVGAMRRISAFMTPATLLNIYYALVQSHLSYAIKAWGGSAPNHLNRLSSLQNRALRLLSSSDNFPDIYAKYRVLTVHSLYSYFCSIKFYKCHVLGHHQFFCSNICLLIPSHDHVSQLAF